MDSFRIVAPETAQGAPFEEHGGADTRTVVDREALNVENRTSHNSLLQITDYSVENQ
jgi:hypothetical protein